MVVLNSFISGILDVAVRLVHWHRGTVFTRVTQYVPKTWYAFIYLLKWRKTNCCCRTENQYTSWILADPSGDIIYAQFLNYEKAMEMQAIILTQTIQIVWAFLINDKAGVPHVCILYFYYLLDIELMVILIDVCEHFHTANN